MKDNGANISYRVALGRIVSALCLLSMLLAGVIPALYLVMPMISGFLIMFIAVEVNPQWAFLTYGAASLLSLLISLDKEAALVFIMLFGHYPILRLYIKKLKSRIIRTVVKFAVLNICVTLFMLVTIYLLGLTDVLEWLEKNGKPAKIGIFALVNVLFIFYEINLESSHYYYIKRIRSKFRQK